jgi:hypothetical protein
MKTVLAAVCIFIVIGDASYGEEKPENPVLVAVAPIYPLTAYLARFYGAMQVEVEVNNAGEVIKAKAGTRNLVADASENAAKKWKFISVPDKSSIRKYAIKFLFKLMPDYTEDQNILTIYNAPYEMEVRAKLPSREETTMPRTK